MIPQRQQQQQQQLKTSYVLPYNILQVRLIICGPSNNL